MDLTPYLESVRSDLEAVAGLGRGDAGRRRSPGPRPGGIAPTPDAGRARPGGAGAGRAAALGPDRRQALGPRRPPGPGGRRARSPRAPDGRGRRRHGADHAPAAGERQDPGGGAGDPRGHLDELLAHPRGDARVGASNSSSVSAGWATGSPVSPRASRRQTHTRTRGRSTTMEQSFPHARQAAAGDAHPRRLDPPQG